MFYRSRTIREALTAKNAENAKVNNLGNSGTEGPGFSVKPEIFFASSAFFAVKALDV